MRVAVLSVHSHRDRSFLDDRELALVAGDLRAAGVESDLVAAFFDARAAAWGQSAELQALEELLSGYDVIVYERVWSADLIAALRERLPGRVFVSCEGEHKLADPPADYVCAGVLRASVPSLIAHLEGGGPLPRYVRVRDGEGWREGLGEGVPPSAAFCPNLRPLLVGAEEWARTFSIVGNAGCPYRADARDNPLYAGVEIPERYGRGCAFCTTGNWSEASPAPKTAERVLEQLRYVRREAPELDRLVLKDQNPFGWLTEVVERCVEEGLGSFSLLLETRVDWFLRNERRFERALELAARADIRLCPFLIGIENFSPPELARFNKGTSAEANERFLNTLAAWDERHGALDLSHAAFGFVLLTPWTTLEDLRTNLQVLERTGFDRRRGHLLVSRARLYPDTALYYLAERDGLLEERHASVESDNARRYGYFPASPWRFASPVVARFAELAAELTRERGGKDELRLFRILVEAFEGNPEVEFDAIRRRLAAPGEAELRARLARLLAPLSLERPFEGGWRIGPIAHHAGRLRVRLEHEDEPTVTLEIIARRGPPERAPLARSRHYDLCADPESPRQRQALRVVCQAIARNDAR